MQTKEKNRKKPLDYTVGFCEAFKIVTKGLALHITLKTADLHKFLITKIGVDNIVRMESLQLFVSTNTPNPETHIMFNNSIKKCFTLSFDSWTTDRKTANTGNVY